MVLWSGTSAPIYNVKVKTLLVPMLLAAITLVAIRVGEATGDDVTVMIQRNCALFYGSEGAAAELKCRVEMQHRYPTSKRNDLLAP